MEEGVTWSEESHERLGELRLCQEHYSASLLRSWQASGIIMAGAMAALALMLHIEASSLASAVITTAFGLGAVIALQTWRKLIQREAGFQHVSVVRMRQLEQQLGFRRQLYIQLLDDWDKRSESSAWCSLPEEERIQFEKLYVGNRRLPPKEGASAALQVIGLVVEVGWVVIVLWRWLVYAGLLD